MNENRNQGRTVKPQAVEKHPQPWQDDLNPSHMAGQNIGAPTDTGTTVDRTAFHLRKAGVDLGRIDDEELKQVPLVPDGARLQEGATYVNLNRQPPREFKSDGSITAQSGDAYVPKDRVPYEIWNRLIGEEKPGQRQ